MKKFSPKELLVFAVLVAFLLFFFWILFQKYNERFGAFGCFDECFNYIGGYFILKGRVLYKEIFFNHQPLMPYASALIQKVLEPSSIYFLVLYHRMFVFFFGALMSVLLIWRFGLAALGFVGLFEATKFYFMGSLFLAESILVYPLVYLAGLAFEKVSGRKLSTFDYILTSIFAWFIIFLREPVFFAALFLFAVIHFEKNLRQVKWLAGGLFAFLTILTLVFTSLPDYFLQVVLMNSKTILLSELASYGNFANTILETFFYPVVILIEGKQTFMREILIGLDLLFFATLIIFLLKSTKRYLVFIVLFALGLANLRAVPPGLMFYEAFHALPWYGLFIFFTFLLLQAYFRLVKTSKFSYLLVVYAVSLVAFSMLSPQSFLRERIDKDREFHGNFDRYYIFGEAIKHLAKPADTLFLEQWDDFIYWQSGLDSSYPYAIYAGSSKSFPQFIDARAKMFQDHPPDFYYSPCRKGTYLFDFLPESQSNEYVQLIYVNEPSCLFVKKQNLLLIPKDRWEKLNVLRFYLPKEEQ